MMESFESYLYDIKHFWYWFVASVIKRTYVLVSKQIELVNLCYETYRGKSTISMLMVVGLKPGNNQMSRFDQMD
jgi:hypothetical protein